MVDPISGQAWTTEGCLSPGLRGIAAAMMGSPTSPPERAPTSSTSTRGDADEGFESRWQTAFSEDLRSALLADASSADDGRERRWWATVLGPWYELCRTNDADQVEFRVLSFRRGQRLVALGFCWVVPDYDCAKAVGGLLYAVARRIRRIRPRLLKFRMGFLMPPHLDGPGLWVDGQASSEQRREIYELARHRLQEIDCDAMCVFDRERDQVLAECFRTPATVSMPHVPRSVLNLGRGRPALTSFDAWLASIPSKWRIRVRKNIGRFTRAEAKFVDVRSSESGARVFELFERTREKQEAAGSPHAPLHMTPKHFDAIDAGMAGAMRIRGVEVDGQLVGFYLLISSGDRASLSLCGSDYETSQTSAAYFNFYYDCIAAATELGAVELELGYTHADIKRRLGATAYETRFFIELRHRLLRPLASLVATKRDLD